MGADIANRAQSAAHFCLQTPVPIGGFGQPILMVVAGHEADVTEITRLYHPVGLLVERVKTDVIADRADLAGGVRQFHQLGRLGTVHGQWLFADNVFSGSEDRFNLGVMREVGRGHVYDIDVLIREQLVKR